MIKNSPKATGSLTAKMGFANERDIADKFNNWELDKDSQTWLETMGYKINDIEKVVAIVLPPKNKSDIQVQITIFLRHIIAAENISVKLVSHDKGFNQVDKRWVDSYKELWDIPEDVITALKYFTGELTPYRKDVRDSRRMFLDEFIPLDREKVIQFFTKKKMLVVSDILKGRGKLAAEWMLVVVKYDDIIKWQLKPMNVALNIFGSGEIIVTKQGNLKIGNITMQRKGGDAGRKTANMLQFKINPILVFEHG